jgi:outer membrane protein assembly factor BamB
MQIDPRRRGQLPRVDPPVSFMSKDGQIRGWRVSIPGRRPLATPAVLDGRLFLGGGFGSYEFYAFDADSGRVAWQYQTADDGPTAAVAKDDFVAFNTESCELEVLTVTGKPVWKVWLGDPLMSMPAIHRRRVYVSFPDSRGDRRHYLAAFDLGTGREMWRQPIDAETISAPVVVDDDVYLSNVAGTIFRFRQTDGQMTWRQPKNATSSPMVWRGQCYFSQRREVSNSAAGKHGPQQMEHLATRGIDPDSSTMVFEGTEGLADYLDFQKRQMRSPRYAASMGHDAAVGFSAHKGDANMRGAMGNLGHAHVFGIWAYQGSKPTVYRGKLYGALGDTVYCADPATQAILWKRRLGNDGAHTEVLDSALTPPVTVNGKLFLGSIQGELFCLAATSGDILWSIRLGEPIIFQPAVARGRVFVGTEGGSLYSLETGDAQDDGWQMWGGTAAHNGLAEG